MIATVTYNEWENLCITGHEVVSTLRAISKSYVLNNTLDLLEWLVAKMPNTRVAKATLLDQIEPFEMTLMDIATATDDKVISKQIFRAARYLGDAINDCRI